MLRFGLILFGMIVVAAVLGSMVGADSADSGEPAPPTADLTAPAHQHPVEIRRPSRVSGVSTGQVDAQGHLVTVACATCHSLLGKPEPQTLELTSVEYHSFEFAHGNLTCNSCHDPEAPLQLRFADGNPVAEEDLIDLCSQCHGPQRTDFDHGAHGGMTGYWDLSRGPRTRNHCVSCHAPHAPAIPQIRPTFKPKDRFLSPSPSPSPSPKEETAAGGSSH